MINCFFLWLQRVPAGTLFDLHTHVIREEATRLNTSGRAGVYNGIVHDMLRCYVAGCEDIGPFSILSLRLHLHRDHKEVLGGEEYVRVPDINLCWVTDGGKVWYTKNYVCGGCYLPNEVRVKKECNNPVQFSRPVGLELYDNYVVVGQKNVKNYVVPQIVFEHIKCTNFIELLKEYIASNAELTEYCKDINFDVSCGLKKLDHLPKIYLIVAFETVNGMYTGKTYQLLYYRVFEHKNDGVEAALRDMLKSERVYVTVIGTLPIIYRIRNDLLLLAEDVVNMFTSQLCRKLNIKHLNKHLNGSLPQGQFGEILNI